MEILVLLIIVPLIISAFIALGASVFAVVVSAIVGVIALAINFWYITLAILLVLLAPVIYLNGWLAWVLVPIAIVALAIYFVPLSDEQKAEIQRLKNELKNS
nr:MAG TPA: Nematode polyprotein allergen ABA-1 [Caudoviricetes sp.]